MTFNKRAWLLGAAGILPVLALWIAAAPPAASDMRRWAIYSVITPAGPEEPPPAAFQSLKRLVWADHKLVNGENSASQLAKTYRTTLSSLQATNNEELYLLGIGRKIKVLNQDGLLYEVKKDSETLDRIVRKFHWEPRQARRFKEWVVKANDLPGSALIGDYEFMKGERILLPGIKINFDTYHYPVNSPRLSSRFGVRRHPIFRERRMHVGIDIAKPYGTPVYSARSGIVLEAGWREGYGMLVIIRHADGFTTRYGHMSKISVVPGQVVQRGKTMIGRVGSTGNSTGPHLHFEVRNRNGAPVNPSAKIGRP
ncbi:MAG: M23 family metallopeptidase [Elusimicrobiota bacterium]|jgi:murein DD-endopeptidase MepM/ murein hydrolase activator NlpD